MQPHSAILAEKSSGLEIFRSLRTRDAVRSRAQERLLIEMAVGWVFGVQYEAIVGTTRGRNRVALARQVAMYLAHVVCGHSLTRVGDMFARDRTTVAHACMVVEDRRDNSRFDHTLELLELSVASLLAPRNSFDPNQL